MDALRTSLGQLNLKNVTTYIQSGNVLFETTEQAIPTLETLIERHLFHAFGFEIPTIIRPQTQLQTIAASQPFPDSPSENLGIYVAFLKELPSQEKQKELMALSTGDETLLFQNNELYIRYKKGAGTAKLTNNFIEKKLGTLATTRNWVTLGKLVTEKIEKDPK